MKRNVRWHRGGVVAWLSALALALPALAGLEDFKLARAIPADAALVVHSRDHAGKAFLNAQYERVWKAVEKQHFERDIRTLLKGLAEENGGDVEEFDRQWQRFNDLLLGVEWSALAERELAFAMKLEFPAPELIFLGAAGPEKAKANFEGLTALLKTLISFAPEGELVLNTQGEGDSVVHTLPLPIPGFQLAVTLAREKDVLLIGFGRTMPEQALALLRGETGQTLAATERFKAGLKRLPPPADSVVFFDLVRWMGQIRVMIEKAMSSVEVGGQELDPKVKALPGRIFDALDMFDYVAAVATTDGMKTTADSILALRDGAQSRPLYSAFFGNAPLKEPLKLIPENAVDFSVWNGINLKALYDAILAFIRDDVPGGPDILTEWDATKAQLKAEFNLDIETDLLGWVGGGLSSFSLPGKTAFQPGGSVFMLSVRDEAKAREMLGRLLEMLEPMLTQQNGTISEAKIEGAEGFQVIGLQWLVMVPNFSQPTLGVKDGQLFIGASPKAVAAALDTAAGKTPNFATNERFRKEGLPLEPNVTSLGFTDLTGLGDQLGQVFKTVPMLLMLVPDVGKNPVGRAVLTAAGKLGTVVEELNFFQSACSRTTMNGPVVYTKSVYNYREPPKRPAPAEEPAEGEKSKEAGEKPEPGQ